MDSGRRHSDSGGGSGPGRKPSWYERCFPIRKEPRHFQPSEEALRNSQERQRLSDQTPSTSRGQRREVPTSDHQRGDIGRSGDDTPRNSRTTREASHGEAAQEHTNIKQLVDKHLKEAKKTSEQNDRLLSEIRETCNELIKYDDTDLELTGKIVKISDNTSKEIDEHLVSFRNACKELENAGNWLETLGRVSRNVREQITKEIDEHLVSFRNTCDELGKTKDQLEALRDFSHVWKQVNEAQTQLKADLSKATGENSRRINELAKDVENRIKNVFNETLDHPWTLQNAHDELRKAKDQLDILRSANEIRTQVEADHSEATGENPRRINELAKKIVNNLENDFKIQNDLWIQQNIWNELRKLKALKDVSDTWEQAHEIEVKFIGALSEEFKDAAGKRIEMVDRTFKSFLSSFEQEYSQKTDRPVKSGKEAPSLFNGLDHQARLSQNIEMIRDQWQASIESNCKNLKLLVVEDKWNKLLKSREIHHLIKDQKDLTTSMRNKKAIKTLEDRFRLAWLKDDVANASTLVNQIAESVLKSYEIKTKTVNLSRRTRMVDSLRALLGMRKEHRPERMNKIVGEFNKTLGEMKGKLAAVPEEVKDKLVEKTIAIMKDFKESYDDALSGYGKRKGRTAREGGEKKIKELNQRISEMNKDLDRWHPVQKALGDLEQAPASYTAEDRNSLHEYLDATIKSYKRVLDAYRQGSDLPDAREQYERARQDFLEAKDQIDLRNMSEKLANSIFDQIKNNDVYKNNYQVQEYIGGFEKYLENPIKISKELLDKKYFYAACKAIEEIAHPNERILEDFRKMGISINIENIDNKLEGIKRRYSDYSGEISGTATQGKKEPNEDAYLADENHQVYAVFDGVTGKPGGSGGHLASALAVDSLRQSLDQFSDKSSVEDVKKSIDNILRKANQEIFNNRKENYSEMLTTASIVKVMKDGTAVIGNVGDSRVYCLRNNNKSVEQLTLDNNVLLEAVNLVGGDPRKVQERLANAEDYQGLAKKLIEEEVNPKLTRELCQHLGLEVPLVSVWSELTKSLGDPGSIEPNISTCQLEPGDRLIITSDGIHDNLTDKQIVDCILNESDPKKAGEALVQQAKEKSGEGTPRSKPDDTTAIVVEYHGEGGDSARSNGNRGEVIDESNIASTSGGQETSERAEASTSYTAVSQSIDLSQQRNSQEDTEINHSDDSSNETPAERQARLLRQAGLSE